MPQYTEKEKNIVRNECLSAAVKQLTSERTSATLIPVDYMSNVKKFLLKSDNGWDVEYASELTTQTISRWEAFFKTSVGNKNPDELKIAYLCGPNPLNDLKVLSQLGVLPENVWAFENENRNYIDAVESVLVSTYRYIKIIKGDLSNFLSHSPIKFDIVYLDFCGPLPSRSDKQKNLATVTSLFHNHALNSPGIIITNFALPDGEQDEEGHLAIGNLVANYLYPKDFLEYSEDNKHWMTEGPIANGFDTGEEWEKVVLEDIDNYYGQFITRLITDMGSVIIPYHKLSQNRSYLKMFFNSIFDEMNLNKKSKSLLCEIHKMKNWVKDEDGDFSGGDIYSETGMYSIVHAFEMLKDNEDDSAEFRKLKSTFFNQLSYEEGRDTFIQNIDMMYFLAGENFKKEEFLSASLKKIEKNWHPFEKYLFCDVFMFHQLKELLIGQLIVPYHVNIDKTLRWSYKAKETRMFTDMFVFDECRYLYDWMPTMDMLENNLADLDIQLSFRFILDGISKHSRWYNTEFFSGTAIISQDQKGFEAKNLKPRQFIN